MPAYSGASRRRLDQRYRRKLTARAQGRVGPPITQAFYDAAKLWAKDTPVANPWLPFCSWVYLGGAATSVVLFFLGSDLLLVFFVQAVGAVFLVIGALSVPSPYSQVGAQRELLQMLAYEPLLILVIVGIYVTTGSFRIESVFMHDKPLLLELPLLFVVLGYALTIKLRKSPFDISGSHHAHQEIVKGVYTEYAGRNLALPRTGPLVRGHLHPRLRGSVLGDQPGGCGGPARRHLRA